MCNNPLYRIVIDEIRRERLSPQFCKRVRNNALILSYEDKEFCRKTYGFPEAWFTPIPCGSCAGCRIDYSRNWAARCMLEGVYHTHKYFITLTYNDEHLPREDVVNPLTGEVLFVNVLRKRDFQLFMKRLRKKIAPARVRVFYSGEYGDKTDRPHFHCILYGYEFSDRHFFYSVKDGHKRPYHVPGGTDYFISNELTALWGNGHCLISNVDTRSCMYVASYCSKKVKKPKNEFERSRELVKWGSIEQTTRHLPRKLLDVRAIQREFACMSRRPALGRQFFDDHKDEIYAYDKIPYPFDSKGLPDHLRYFDNLYAPHPKEWPGLFPNADRLRAFKEIRALKARAREVIRRRSSSLSAREAQLQAEEVLQQKIERSRSRRDL